MYKRVILEHKYAEPNGDIIEIRISEIETGEEYPEGVRYSFVYIRDGKRLVGYDNYHGKGHHRHVKEREEPYEFIDVWHCRKCLPLPSPWRLPRSLSLPYALGKGRGK